jgi:large subunit ribosomal protein L7Ae
MTDFMKEENMNSVYEIVEKARKTGKIEKGTNEVTKAIERGVAKFVVYAEDVQPKEIVQHLPILCKEKGIPFATADSKQKLGTAAGISVATASIAVIDAGESAGKIAELAKDMKKEAGEREAAKEKSGEAEKELEQETEKKTRKPRKKAEKPEEKAEKPKKEVKAEKKVEEAKKEEKEE